MASAHSISADNYGRELFRELEFIQLEMRCGFCAAPANESETREYLEASKSQVDRFYCLQRFILAQKPKNQWLCDVVQDVYEEWVIGLSRMVEKHGAESGNRRGKRNLPVSYLPSPLREQVYPRGMVDNKEASSALSQ